MAKKAGEEVRLSQSQPLGDAWDGTGCSLCRPITLFVIPSCWDTASSHEKSNSICTQFTPGIYVSVYASCGSSRFLSSADWLSKRHDDTCLQESSRPCPEPWFRRAIWQIKRRDGNTVAGFQQVLNEQLNHPGTLNIVNLDLVVNSQCEAEQDQLVQSCALHYICHHYYTTANNLRHYQSSVSRALHIHAC